MSLELKSTKAFLFREIYVNSLAFYETIYNKEGVSGNTLDGFYRKQQVQKTTFFDVVQNKTIILETAKKKNTKKAHSS